MIAYVAKGGRFVTPRGNGIDVVVSVDSIHAISERFANTAYGFSKGREWHTLFSIEGLDAMLENGPWFIWNNPLILKKWHLDENLLKEDFSTVPLWVKLHGVPVTAFSEDGLSAIATKLGTPLMLDSYTSNMCMQSWGRSSFARVMIELRADVELKDNIVVAMPKITREGHYTCAGEKKTVKKPSQTSRGVSKGVEPTIEVSNSNLFDVLNSVDHDVKFGTNGGTTNLVNNEATSSGSSFMNIDNNREFASNIPIVPTGIVESDSKVKVVFDETSNLRISTSGKDGSDKGYGTNSLFEQWRDSYPDTDDYDPYDDDMYENHDLSKHLQSICDDLDITVRVPQYHQRSSKSNENCSTREIVSLDEEEEIASIQDKYEHNSKSKDEGSISKITKHEGTCLLQQSLRQRPRSYVDGVISRINSWEEVISKVSSWLSKWKLETFSIGVGNGEDSLFWEDIWLDEMTLKYQSPRLFALESSKQITMGDKLNSVFLATSYRRVLRGGIEEERQRLLQSLIDGINLSLMFD
ncbi:glucomannan 4-beta-mannosyltransferase 9-like protein [Tanacetum coccineum]